LDEVRAESGLERVFNTEVVSKLKGVPTATRFAGRYIIPVEATIFIQRESI
jgi:hypothetical protein